jgi:hypothetical protein
MSSRKGRYLVEIPVGIIENTKTGHYQTWISFDEGKTFQWITAHAAKEQAYAICQQMLEAQQQGVFQDRAQVHFFLGELSQKTEFLTASVADAELEEIRTYCQAISFIHW